ncbi:Ig-like domain-containing protein [Maribacter litoralis]|uniref:Ig-like domain-containing protein n=1 Tax=Maribacter litoralis TaxID=2059726 RepID=UPI003F5CBD84
MNKVLLSIKFIKHFFFSNLFFLIILLFISTDITAQSQVILNPIHDAYLEDGIRKNEEVLRVEAGSRVRESYLMFDLSGINGTVTSLSLTLTVYTDPGSGTISLYKGDNNNWTENTISGSNKPSTPDAPIASLTGTHSENDVKTIALNTDILDNSNLLSFVLKHSTNSDVAFASKGPESSSTSQVLAAPSKWPKLIVTYTETSNNIPVNSVSTNISSLDMQVGSTSQQVNAVILPNNATNQNIFWTSSDNTVASVNSSGFITAEEVGQTIITVTTEDGNKSAQIAVSVSTSSETPSSDNYWEKSGSNLNFLSGNVGIGTDTPNSMLAVNGNIRAKEVKVETANWPDYVFALDYYLPSIKEVQQHILENGHLMNIPPAVEMETRGLELGEMNRLLLEKIEELTLYIIELKIQNDQQQEDIDYLKKQTR